VRRRSFLKGLGGIIAAAATPLMPYEPEVIYSFPTPGVEVATLEEMRTAVTHECLGDVLTRFYSAEHIAELINLETRAAMKSLDTFRGL
jgi:hypothetical protein